MLAFSMRIIWLNQKKQHKNNKHTRRREGEGNREPHKPQQYIDVMKSSSKSKCNF